MTAQEKAQELVDKMREFQEEYSTDGWELSKGCAIIAVDEIIDLDSGDAVDKDYWLEVKVEIKKL